jgi:hypothetical protein
MTNKISVSTLANRSISISLEEGLLAQLDAQGSNRSALVSEALSQWLARRRIDALNTAYAHLASLEAGDLAEAGEAAVAMGLAALVAPGVRNSGLIEARLGRVVLGAANAFTLDFHGTKAMLLCLEPDRAGVGQVGGRRIHAGHLGVEGRTGDAKNIVDGHG